MKILSLVRPCAALALGAIAALAGSLPASAQTAPYSRTVIVPANSTATANGTALLAAVAGLSPAPSYTNRWLIKLEPGVYNVGTSPVVLSQYVDIEGSGVVDVVEGHGVGRTGAEVGDSHGPIATIGGDGGVPHRAPQGRFPDPVTPRPPTTSGSASIAAGSPRR
ncbi:MAG TPA: hypothetical protein VLV54_16535 [Thermoanaerobaculia bacterium]|nr:hypothetical protein [Thermoanaerobaculia bacterium]